MARQVDTSLIVTSKLLSLAELSTALERVAGSDSHDKDESHPSGSRWNVTIWRENPSEPSASFESQCMQLLNDVPPKLAGLLAPKVADLASILDIAVFYDTAFTNTVISAQIIRKMAELGIGLEITAYPCSESKGATAKSC